MKDTDNDADVRFLPAGDCAVSVEFGQTIDPVINDMVLSFNSFLKKMREEDKIIGITETIPSYRSLLICFDNRKINAQELIEKIKKLYIRTEPDADNSEEQIRTWMIPCCYGSHFGLDLDQVCKETGLDREEVIRRHSSREYRIYMMGFLPGFVYLGGLDPQLSVPRLSIPRVKIPRGAVGIGGVQTGIYPMESPGGWKLIGSTPLDLYDPDRSEPVFFRAGDRIRFVPVTSCEYYDIRQRILRGEYQPELIINGKTIVNREPFCRNSYADRNNDSSAEEFLEILHPGVLTTVQDAGRFGYQDLGVPVSGAMDLLSWQAGNILLGNKRGEASLEMSLWGGSIRFLGKGSIVLTGADMRPKINGIPVPMAEVIEVHSGDMLTLSMAVSGCRTYLAVSGGIQVPEIMESRSTYIRCGIGGFKGRALKTGDRLRAGDRKYYDKSYYTGAGIRSGGLISESQIEEQNILKTYYDFIKTIGSEEITVRVIPGPQDSYFTENGGKTFFSGVYTLTQESDRMGCRLEGPVIESVAGTDIVSDGIAAGSIQVPGSGKPIILMADRQTTGGYAKIATVVTEDLPLVAQAVPGTKIRFRSIRDC